jgi:hypothetical protein
VKLLHGLGHWALALTSEWIRMQKKQREGIVSSSWFLGFGHLWVDVKKYYKLSGLT